MSAPPESLADAKAAQLKATVESTIERLVQQLAAGHTEEYRALLAFWSRFHRYSHANVLLILAQRPDATQVAGYHTWRRVGRQVRRGARAIAIWCPIVKTIEDEQTSLPVELCVGFTPCPVFAAQDLVDFATNPLPTLWRPLPDDVPDLCRRLRARIVAAGYPVEEAILPPGRQGVSSADRRIVVTAGLDSRTRTLVLLHELAHQLEHFRPEREAAERDQRELEAESAAVVIGAMLGLEHPTARDYILMYRGDGERLKQSLGAIHRLVTQMVTLLDPDHLLHQATAPMAAD